MLIKMGHCRQCGNCCKYILESVYKKEWDAQEYSKYCEHLGAKILDYDGDQLNVALFPVKCKYIKKKHGKYMCKIHNKKKQSRTCRTFPEKPNGFFNVMQKMGCGFWFEEIEVDIPYPLG